MKITYVQHSGFVMEWKKCVWIFDYWKGELPEFDKGKKVFVFGSHNHADHFNPDIVKLLKDCSAVEYVLSDDIRFRSEQRITRLAPQAFYEADDGAGNVIVIRTFTSTDCGVAFLVEYLSKKIYHAGDLNCWVWKEDDEETNRVRTELYQEQVGFIKEVASRVDVAFIPLDPRQEEWYDRGMIGFLKQVDAKVVFPMHFWNKYGVIKKWKESEEGEGYGERIMEIERVGQEFVLEG